MGAWPQANPVQQKAASCSGHSSKPHMLLGPRSTPEPRLTHP